MNALFKKLNLKNLSQILVLNAPKSFAKVMAELADANMEVKCDIDVKTPVEFCLCFVENQQVLNAYAPLVINNVSKDAMLWFAYPKKSSKKYNSDINRDHGWQLLGDLGFEGVRQVAIDENWSALRFRHADFIKLLTRDPKWLMSKQGQKKSTRP